jgi:hypothetical protein
MALVDPNIAMSYRGIELPNQLAQYGQVQAIQNAQRQNKLADLQMQEYERARAEEEGVRNYLAGADLTSPETRAGLARFGKLGMEYNTALSAQEKAALEKQKTQLEIDAKKFENQNKKLDFTLQAIGSSPTPERAISYIKQGLRDGIFSMEEASRNLAMLQNITPEGFAQYRMGQLQRTLAAKDQLEVLAPQIDLQDVGGSLIGLQGNRYQPGYRQPVPGFAPIPKTSTIGERTAQGNLALAQKRFDYEQANPGFELKENEDGTFYAIDKRTKQATPITIGGAAPVAPVAAPAATAAVPGVPGSPAAAVPAVPGTPAAGTVLRGKGTPMNQDQSNAALFGGAMTQAQSVIKDVASRGTYKSAIVPGVLEGLVKLAPFGVGDAAANAIESTFRTDPTGLVGPDKDQQKLAQAQIAFATAYLRKTSGAAFGAQEVANTIKEFFPLRGEGDDVIQQKEAARDRVIEGIALGTNKEGRAHINKYSNPQFPGFSIAK